MMKNFKLKKPNIWRNFLDLIGYDYNRITFEYGRDRYTITSWGRVFINGYKDLDDVYELDKGIRDEIYNEIKKLY